MIDAWSDIEVELIIADYFAMLQDELKGKAYSKADHRRNILPLLNNRSEGSIEFKYQNISAVLSKFGVPWIIGYKPRWNYQLLLEAKVSEYIKRNMSLERDFFEFAEGDIAEQSKINLQLETLLDNPPERNIVMETKPSYTPVKINFLEIEQNNKRLGNYGEEIILLYERWRLINDGKEALADKIEWVSQTQGDGAGFDILSKNNNGTDRYIEVKTTKLGKDSPIYFSKNEYDFSTRNSDSYFLYRLFNVKKSPKVFILRGKFDEFCSVQAVKFKGLF